MCKSLETLRNNIAKGSRRLSKVTVKNIVNAGEFERIELDYYYDGYEVHRDKEIANPIEWFNEKYDSLDCRLSKIKDGIVEIHLTIHSNLWYALYIDLNKDYNKKEQTSSNLIVIPINNDTIVTITYNEEKNGIELRFSEKPSEEVRTQLKENGFRWSKPQGIWYAKQSDNTIKFAEALTHEINNIDAIADEAINNVEVIREEYAITEDQEKLPDANDFNNINTLKDKYVTNWNELPEELQNYILSCDKYWVNLQSVELYQDNKIVASMGVSRWEYTIEINSIGAGELFQWNTSEGYTANNLTQDSNNDNSNVDYNDTEVKTWEETSSKYEPINFDNIEIIDVLDKNIFVNCLIPSLNKNNTKELNDKENTGI